MSNNFGAGQSFFGNNQNKNQGTAAPGSTPAAGTSAFSNLGSNTTGGSAFGGAGAGNTPGGGTAPAPTGGIFGTGSSAFGGGGNTNTPTSTPSGGGTGSLFGGSSLFAGVDAPHYVFMKSAHASTTQQILRQIQGLRRQRRGEGCSQIQVRTQVLRGRRQDKVYLAIPPAQLRGAGLEVRTNQI